MQLSMIVAMAKNRIIGQNNTTPWHLPADLAWFKKNTSHKPIIMGRKTFESIGRALPNRTNIIISRQKQNHTDENVIWVTSLSDAIQTAKTLNSDETFIIGGGNIYQQSIELIDRLYLTHIDLFVEGDTQFPDYTKYQWQTIFSEEHTPDEKNPYSYHFMVLQKI